MNIRDLSAIWTFDQTHTLERQSPLWQRVVRQIFCDLRLWLALMVLFVLYRGLMLLVFRGNMDELWRVQDIKLCFFRGFAYDNVAATVAILPSFIVGLLLTCCHWDAWAFRFRSWMIWLLTVVSSSLAIINIGFFHEYKEQFDQWIFGMIYDDRTAILKTIWREYPALWIVIGALVWIMVGGWLLNRVTGRAWKIEGKIAAIQHKSWRVLLFLALVTCLVFGARGSYGRRPVQLKDAAVTQSRFINALVPNYYMALKYAILNFDHQVDPKQLPPYLQQVGGIRSALTLLYGDRGKSATNLDALLEQSVRRDNQKKPAHIFLVVLESGDMWPMLPEYSVLRMMPEIKGMADQGVLFDHFISTGEGTMPSLGAIISGLPNVGVLQNYQSLSRHPFPTSLTVAFKQLGYKTRLFYGGFLSWQRLGQYAQEQGFDEIYGGGNMVKSAQDLAEWGVPDGELFDYIASHTDDTPTFDLIMTTSYHPPYSLDVDKLGYAIHSIPQTLTAKYDGTVPLRVFAHMRYVDHELGRFVKQFEQQHPGSLFAITGDHWSRRFLNGHPTMYESRAVPLVLYGPQILGKERQGERMTPGSHMDIAPTLIGLSAPKGFVFNSFGRDLLDPQNAQERHFVVGRETVMTATQVVPLDEESDPTIKAACQAWLGVAWWRLLRGPELPAH